MPAPADATKEETLPEALLRIRETKKLPAIGFAAWRDGKELFVFADGERKAGGGKVTVDDRWHLGSNTKAMTAALVGIYVDRGKLKWDDTIGTLFKGDTIHPDYAKVTLDQLVHHTSGAPANPPAELYEVAGKPATRQAVVRGVLAQKPAHSIGTFEYSNTGYIIVGAALERVTKQSWEALMQKDIFDPLDMKSCGFGAPTGESPWGHDASGKAIEPGPEADNPAALGPAGTVHCSLRDYGKYLAVHAGTSPVKLVAPATLERLHRAKSDETYAGGWMAIGSVLVHSGSNTLWFATAIVGLEKRSALVIVANKGDSLENDLFSLVPLVATTYPP